MFAKPINESLPIAMMALGIFLMAWFITTWSFVVGLPLLSAGIVLLYRHYQQSGTDSDLFDNFHATNDISF